ncbi:hypothetical protein U1839_01920 [Sphingomonas sp. RT2P30]
MSVIKGPRSATDQFGSRRRAHFRPVGVFIVDRKTGQPAQGFIIGA